ncbi:hypothetical protein OJ998_37360, partial [Solirubrobacter taibaiensis]|nr:hypothetical protein [Solirubrobacter taibaiensis]
MSAGACGPGAAPAAPRAWRPSVALAVVREHPRHVVLAALVAGLLVDRSGAAAVVAAAVGFAVLAQRPWPAVLAAVAVFAGATVADARLAALDAGVLAHLHGRSIETRVVVLEPVRDRVRGPSAARVRLLDGPGAGEQAVLRSYAWPRAAASSVVAGGAARGAASGGVVAAGGAVAGGAAADGGEATGGG